MFDNTTQRQHQQSSRKRRVFAVVFAVLMTTSMLVPFAAASSATPTEATPEADVSSESLSSTIATTSTTSTDPNDTADSTDDWNAGTNENTSPRDDLSRYDNLVEQQSGILGDNTREKFWPVRRGYGDWVAFTANATSGDIDRYTSSDGYNWTGGDVAASLSNHDLEDPTVVKYDGTWYMYTEDSGNQELEVFSSSDTVSWTHETTVTSLESPASPVATVHNGEIHVFYEKYPSGDCNSGEPCAIKYGTSTDGTTFTDQSEVLNETGGEAPDSIFHANGQWNIYYHDVTDELPEGSKFKRATSGSLTGTYNVEGTAPDFSSYHGGGVPTAATVPVEPNGSWAGLTEGEHLVYYWDTISGRDEVAISHGIAPAELTIETAEEDGDVTEWNDNPTANVFQSQSTTVGDGSYSREIQTSSSGDGSYDAEVWANSTTVSSPDETSFLINITNTTDGTPLQLRFRTGGTQITALRLDGRGGGDNVQVLNASSGWYEAGDFPGNEWARIRIDWDWANDTYDLYVNGEARNIDHAFAASANGFDQTRELWDHSAGQVTGYIDTQYRPYRTISGTHTSDWHNFGSETNFTSFETIDAENGQTLNYEFRASDDGTSSTATNWTQNVTDLPKSQYVQVRVSMDGTEAESPVLTRYRINSPTGSVTGVVVDQHGEPVPKNTTVELWGVTETALNASAAETYEEQANDLMDDLENPLPSSWEPNYDLDSHQSGEYLLVHESEDWGRNPDTIGGYEVQTFDDEQVDDPTLNVSEGEGVILSVWDATDSELIGNPVINSFPGTTQQQDIVVEQLSPSDEVVDTQTYESEVIATTGNRLNEQEHYGVHTRLPEGIYKAYPEGAPEKGYTFAVGDADQMADRIEQDLRDEKNKLTQRADTIRSMRGNGELVRRTVTTQDDGTFTAEVPSTVVTVQMQAYRVDGQYLQGTTNASMDDIREAANSGHNGTFILPSPNPDRANPPEEGVRVKTIRSPEVPNIPIDSYADLLEWMRNQRLNDTIADLESKYEQRLENVTRAQLERLYNNSRSLVEGYPPALEYYLSESGYEEVPEAGELTDEELRTQIDLMQSAAFQANRIDMGEPATNVEDVNDSVSTISGSFPVPDGVTEENVAVEIVWSNGTVQQMPDEYWSLSGGGVISDASVDINEYPIESSDAAVANIRVRAANDEGVGEETARIVNPQFSGDVPKLNAIDVSTLRPGVDERVSFQLRAEDGSGYGQIEAVDVYAPDGTVVNTTIRQNGRVSFTPQSQGTHFVRAQYSNTGGDPFVETFSLEAEESSSSQPPTIRARRGPSGTHALAGEGLRSARIEENADRLTVSGVIPGDENAPGKVVVEPQSVMQSGADEIEVRVLRGEDRETVRSHMAVEIHTETFEDDTLLWVNGNAMTQDGTTQYGAVDQRSDNKHVIVTQTNAQGVATVEMTRDPGYVDRARHWADHTFPGANPFMLVDFILDLFGDLPNTDVVTSGLTTAAEPQTPAATTSTTMGVAA